MGRWVDVLARAMAREASRKGFLKLVGAGVVSLLAARATAVEAKKGKKSKGGKGKGGQGGQLSCEGPNTFPLTAKMVGPGGFVEAPLNDCGPFVCGDDCTFCDPPSFSACMRYPANSVVTLTPRPNLGATFVGWSGDCTGSGLCQVTIDRDRSVVATFR